MGGIVFSSYAGHVISRLAFQSRPLLACQQDAIPMAFRWHANNGQDRLLAGFVPLFLKCCACRKIVAM